MARVRWPNGSVIRKAISSVTIWQSTARSAGATSHNRHLRAPFNDGDEARPLPCGGFSEDQAQSGEMSIPQLIMSCSVPYGLRQKAGLEDYPEIRFRSYLLATSSIGRSDEQLFAGRGLAI
ncbi:hypothetical protein FA13DRAFT_1734312 [Coprinellus micaceus]|uniref:Uncharacterized protein n=1 Tax=Coprinellus micaceus TaxID=71717 RepID=A0A4Y7T785_COPMI|nr:hypothetical protein FA13DRAFT_1734312 [Coprinellus micaceus]